MDNDRLYMTKTHKEHKSADLPERETKFVDVSSLPILNTLYDEFKKCFEQKNFSKIEKIIKHITNLDPEANVLNAIYGQICLFKGQGIEAYEYLVKYAQNSQSVDYWALNVMGLWNMFAGRYSLAMDQFATVLQGPFSSKFLVNVLINAAKTKKRLGFWDKALEYFKRIQCVPDGFRMLLIIKLEIIHIFILKNNYDLALKEIDSYSQLSKNCFIKRLRVYTLYLQKNYKEILKYKKDDELDPYISYILARIGLENPKIFNINVAQHLDDAIKNTHSNKYIYNTYGNYYFSIGRYSDAANQYNNALEVDSKFLPAISNLKLFLNTSTKSGQPFYITKEDSKGYGYFSDVLPDVEELGFLDTWKLMGYSSFKVDIYFLRRSLSLKYYFINK